MNVCKRIWYEFSSCRLESARNAEVHPTSTGSEIAARAISHAAIPMGNPEGIRILKKTYFSPHALSSEKFAFIVIYGASSFSK